MSKKIAPEKTKKGPGGRPTKYTAKMPQNILDFFDIELEREIEVEVAGKDGPFKITKVVPNRLPTVEGFCKHIKVDKTTLHLWKKKHPEFSYALGMAKQMQMNHLIQHSLEGTYNAGFAKFLAQNISEYRDKIETTHEASEDIKKLVINFDD